MQRSRFIRSIAPSQALNRAEKKGLSWRFVADAISTAALLCLAIAAGLSWYEGIRTPPVDLVPVEEAGSVIPGGPSEPLMLSTETGRGEAAMSAMAANPTRREVEQDRKNHLPQRVREESVTTAGSAGQTAQTNSQEVNR